MKYLSLFLFPILFAAAAACGGSEPEIPTSIPATATSVPTVAIPTPNVDATVEARVDMRLQEIAGRTATAIAAIPPTATFTATPSPSPTSTLPPTPPPSAPAPSPTPQPTMTATVTVMPTFEPTFSPTATPEMATPIVSQGPTEVSGLLSSDNVWSWINSPYILTGNVVVPEGASLRIEPGVNVDMDGSFIRIEGLLRALGTPDENINFKGLSRTTDGNYLEFGPTADSWVEQTNEGGLVEYVVFRLNTALDDAAIKVEGSAPKLKQIDITNPRSSGIYLKGPAVLEDSRICDNFDWGVLIEEPATVTGNTICGNRQIGILVRDSSPQIRENIVQGNNWLGEEFRGGISIEVRRREGAPIVERNNISDNLGYGVRVFGELAVGDTVITQNVIANNGEIQARLGETRSDVDMTRNYWGTTDRTVIEASLYDEDDESGLKKILFLPLITNPPSGAPVIEE